MIDVTINSYPEWKQWYRDIDNNTYVIAHNSEQWHQQPSKGSNCSLHRRIHRKLSKWNGAECLIRHDSTMNKLWVTVKLPDNFCECGKRIKLDKTHCMPCAVKRTKASKPFYDKYTIREITVLSQDFEHVYRVFKYMNSTDKLIVHHLDCNHIKRCEHIRWFLNKNKVTLPKYTSRTRGAITEIVKLIK